MPNKRSSLLKTFLPALCLLAGSVSTASAQSQLSAARKASAALAENSFARQSRFARRAFIPFPNEQQRMTDGIAAQYAVSARAARKEALKRPAQFAAEYHIPKLQKDRGIVLYDFSAVLPPADTRPPVYPAKPYPGDLTRGMVLKNPAQDLREIFSQGLLTSRAGVDAWTKTRVIFMTNSPQIALLYARADFEGLPVVVHISGFGQSPRGGQTDPGNSQHIAETARDIPAAQIMRVSALLYINGTPRWGQILPLPNGGFLFHPYKNTPADHAKNALIRLLRAAEERL